MAVMWMVQCDVQRSGQEAKAVIWTVSEGITLEHVVSDSFLDTWR